MEITGDPMPNFFLVLDLVFLTMRSWSKVLFGERTDLVVRASDSGSGDPGSILGRVGVLFP